MKRAGALHASVEGPPAPLRGYLSGLLLAVAVAGQGRSADLYLDLARLGVLRLRHGQQQQAVLVHGLDPRRIHRGAQSQRAAKLAGTWIKLLPDRLGALGYLEGQL